MTCDHGDPCKELRYPDPADPPLDYMKHCGVFKAKKSNKYNLCHFYCIELSGNLSTFPSPHKPAIHEMLEDFLLKASALGHPNLVVAFAWDFGHGCLSSARATQQRQPEALAHRAETRCGWEGYKIAVILPVLSVQWQQQPVVHEPHHVWTIQHKLWVWAVPTRGVHHGSAAEKPPEDLCRFPQGWYPLLI